MTYSSPSALIRPAISRAANQVVGKAKLPIKLEHPAVESHGDYSTNIALVLSGQPSSPSKSSDSSTPPSPRALAEALASALRQDKKLAKIVAKIAVAGAGFINFYLKPEVLVSQVNQIVSLGDDYAKSQPGKRKFFIIDYSSPNIAKRFTVGHLRSTIIGQAIYNLYKFQGWDGIGDNHLGDWGTQFGKMIVAIRKWANKSVDKLSIDEMESLYVKFHQAAEKDQSLEEAARKAFKNLEDGKAEERAMWQKLVDRSITEFRNIYDLLKVKVDVAYGESYYENMMPAIIGDAKKKGVAIESQGALIIPYPQDVLPPGMLLKSDGATTYLTRDLATIKFRQDKWNPQLMIYEVGEEQSLHFKQVFWAAELLGWGKRHQFVHIPHGLIRLKEGKMSTRRGNVIKLEAVLAEAINRAKKYNNNEIIAKAVGIGAVKYNDLKHSPITGYTFDWEEILTLEGNSGPYLQYTFARAQSVLSHASSFPSNPPDPSFSSYSPNSEELAILRWIYRFPEVVEKAARQYAPNLLCTFLFDLAQRFNTFYNKHRILDVSVGDLPSTINHQSSGFRLSLTAAVAQILKSGLNLLGIQAPEKM